MLTSKTLAEIIKKNIVNFLVAQIAAVNLFQIDLDNP